MNNLLSSHIEPIPRGGLNFPKPYFFPDNKLTDDLIFVEEGTLKGVAELKTRELMIGELLMPKNREDKYKICSLKKMIGAYNLAKSAHS